MDGFVIILFIVAVIGGYILHSFLTDRSEEGPPRPSKQLLQQQKERTLDGLVQLEQEFKTGALSRAQYVAQRAQLRKRAADTARRISERVLKSRESLGLIIDTERQRKLKGEG